VIAWVSMDVSLHLSVQGTAVYVAYMVTRVLCRFLLMQARNWMRRPRYVNDSVFLFHN
jgi:hypothetical protein